MQIVLFQILPSGVDVSQVFSDDDDMPFPYWLYETVDYGGRLVDKSKSHLTLSGGGGEGSVSPGQISDSALGCWC